MRVYIDNQQIKWFDLNKQGQILDTGDNHKKDWEQTYVDMNFKVGDYITVSFNKRQNERIGMDAVWTQLNYKITKIL